MAGMWVVFNSGTGYSDESMRFAEFGEAEGYMQVNEDPDRDVYFEKRWESDSPHPQNHVALGQILSDGKWVDFARDTPEAAIRWAKREPEGKARVVDWIGRSAVIWP
jgi:hypothetical protein